MAYRSEQARIRASSGLFGISLSSLMHWKRRYRDADLLTGPHEDTAKELSRLRMALSTPILGAKLGRGRRVVAITQFTAVPLILLHAAAQLLEPRVKLTTSCTRGLWLITPI